MSFFIDTHCHLNFNSFENDLPLVLERASAEAVRNILIPGTDLASSRSAVELCGRHPDLYAAIGMHPNDTSAWDGSTISELRELAKSPCVKAIGEIGLDYYREKTEHHLQQEIFRAQLDLAETLKLPVVIHNREAAQDLWPILREWAAGLSLPRQQPGRKVGVLHSFDGSVDLALEAFEAGFLLGISGPVTYKNALARQETIRDIPLEAMLLETDAPFLTPHPHRGRRNEPAYIPLIAAQVAQLKQISLSEVQLTTTKNAMLLFSLGTLD